MYDIQPQVLTDEELAKYSYLWLHENSLPRSYQQELIKRLVAHIDKETERLANAN
jgi:hypothetical protein